MRYPPGPTRPTTEDVIKCLSVHLVVPRPRVRRFARGLRAANLFPIGRGGAGGVGRAAASPADAVRLLAAILASRSARPEAVTEALYQLEDLTLSEVCGPLGPLEPEDLGVEAVLDRNLVSALTTLAYGRWPLGLHLNTITVGTLGDLPTAWLDLSVVVGGQLTAVSAYYRDAGLVDLWAAGARAPIWRVASCSGEVVTALRELFSDAPEADALDAAPRDAAPRDDPPIGRRPAASARRSTNGTGNNDVEVDHHGAV
jgi:hypothetical protein